MMEETMAKLSKHGGIEMRKSGCQICTLARIDIALRSPKSNSSQQCGEFYFGDMVIDLQSRLSF